LVNPESVEDISEGLKRLASDKDLRTEMIKCGQLRRMDFDWDKAAAILYENMKAALNA
jgi:glycosyltransferase involved in cell wall biosynthesis